MSVLEIKQYGDSVLREKSESVKKSEIKTSKFKILIKNMLETMYKKQGVGLAAPQVGINKKLVVIDTEWSSGDKYSPRPIVLINPVIEKYSQEEIQSEEGCLSFNKSSNNSNFNRQANDSTGVMLNNIKRAQKVTVSYIGLDLKKKTITAENNLLAVCLQHEIDHLEGILFIDRCPDEEAVKIQLEQNGFV